MNDGERLLERQALWQQSRCTLSWPQKIYLAEGMRPTLQAFRHQREQRRATGVPDAPAVPPHTGSQQHSHVTPPRPSTTQSR